VWAVNAVKEDWPSGDVQTPISFGIRLAAPLENPGECAPGELPTCSAVVVTLEEQETHKAPQACDGSAESPTAESGHLCLYIASLESEEPATEEVTFTEEEMTAYPANPATEEFGASTTGAILLVHQSAASPRGSRSEVIRGRGTWAVTG
jgi:hypothetical protein